MKDLKKSVDNWDQMKQERNIMCDNINKYKIENYGKSFVDNFVYGPIFYTLNKSMQEQFLNLLNELEITSEINNFVKYSALNRERREYIGWMYKILNFLNLEDNGFKNTGYKENKNI